MSNYYDVGTVFEIRGTNNMGTVSNINDTTVNILWRHNLCTTSYSIKQINCFLELGIIKRLKPFEKKSIKEYM